MVGDASRPTLRFTPDLTVSGFSAPTDSLAVSVQANAIELAGQIRVRAADGRLVETSSLPLQQVEFR